MTALIDGGVTLATRGKRGRKIERRERERAGKGNRKQETKEREREMRREQRRAKQ